MPNVSYSPPDEILYYTHLHFLLRLSHHSVSCGANYKPSAKYLHQCLLYLFKHKLCSVVLADSYHLLFSICSIFNNNLDISTNYVTRYLQLCKVEMILLNSYSPCLISYLLISIITVGYRYCWSELQNVQLNLLVKGERVVTSPLL